MLLHVICSILKDKHDYKKTHQKAESDNGPEDPNQAGVHWIFILWMNTPGILPQILLSYLFQEVEAYFAETFSSCIWMANAKTANAKTGTPSFSFCQLAEIVANRPDSSSAWVKENPGWWKIGVMCLEYWQRADQYHLVWDYVKLICGLREHLFHWEQTTASFITVLTKSLQISHPKCDPRRSLWRGAMETFPMLRVKFLHFNPVKYLKTPLC